MTQTRDDELATTMRFHVRGVKESVADRFRQAALGRDWFQAEYLEALVNLHTVMRGLADAGNDDLQDELVALGLETKKL